jgi:hypothetical protein
MKILIQHNFTSGLGDFINCVYEYYSTCENLKKIGYRYFVLCINLENNVYLHKENFWEIFNKSTLEAFFNEVYIIDNPISEMIYGEYICVNTISNATPSLHLWDIFINNGEYAKLIKKYLIFYNYSKPNYEFIDIFTPELMLKYNNIKYDLGLIDYISIYIRTFDLQDNEDKYECFEEKYFNLNTSNENIFIASNSFLFKKNMKNKYSNIIVQNIVCEDLIGNHYNYNKQLYHNKNIIKERTESVIFDMLLLSESKKIYFFSVWNRPSNFLILSLVKDTKIEEIYL